MHGEEITVIVQQDNVSVAIRPLPLLLALAAGSTKNSQPYRSEKGALKEFPGELKL